jgi:uncharacterized BrkB/YihY/UPF0761 family membrane protein
LKLIALCTDRLHQNDRSGEIVRLFQPALRTRISKPSHTPCQPFYCAFSLALVSALFALIYRCMPARRLAWSVVLSGGVLTAVLFDIGRWGIGLYLAHSTQPSAFAAAASFAALLLWLYYTAQIFLVGAEFTACLGGVREEKSTPDNSGASRRSR